MVLKHHYFPATSFTAEHNSTSGAVPCRMNNLMNESMNQWIYTSLSSGIVVRMRSQPKSPKCTVTASLL